jgi:hypothetical protein
MQIDGSTAVGTRVPIGTIAGVCILVLALLVGPVAASPRPGGAAGPVSAPVWSIVPTPNPPDSMVTVLEAVDCTTEVDCMAVGKSFLIDGRIRTLAERWDGEAWTIVHTPNRPHDVYNLLDSVSCLAPDDCTAVGSSLGSVGRALVEHGTGSPGRSKELPLRPSGWCWNYGACHARRSMHVPPWASGGIPTPPSR